MFEIFRVQRAIDLRFSGGGLAMIGLLSEAVVSGAGPNLLILT